MPYRKWKRVVEEYGDKPMQQILTDLYAELGSHRLVANRLGVTLKGLREWRLMTGCNPVVRIECELVTEEPEREMRR